MKEPIHRLTVLLPVAVLLIFGSALPVQALDDFEFTKTLNFPVGASPKIEMKSVAGNLSYTGTSGTMATVRMVVRVHARDEDEARAIQDEIDITVEGRKGRLEASAERPNDFGRMLRRRYGQNRSIKVSFHVTGPEGGGGEWQTVAGNINVSGIAGTVDANTISGSLTLQDIESHVGASTISGEADLASCGGDVDVNTVSGNIRLDDAGRQFRGHSVSGKITAKGVNGTAEVSTVSGDVKLINIRGAVEIQTTSGDIRAEHTRGDLIIETISGDVKARTTSPDGELSVETTSGAVALYVDPGNIGEVEFSTFSGEITLETDVRVRKHTRNGLTGRIGDGNVSIRIDTQSGDILFGEL